MFSNPMFAPQGPAAPAMPSGQQGGMGGGTFTDLLNSLSGNSGGSGFDMNGISDAIQGLSYGIGSFAKNPQTRAAYIQAAQMHSQHKNANANQDYQSILSLAPEYQKIIEQARGNPAVMQALMPSLQHWGQNLGMAARRAGKDPSMASALVEAMTASSQLPATGTRADDFTLSPGQTRYVDGKPVASAPAEDKPPGEFVKNVDGKWVINQEYVKAHAAIAAAGRAPQQPDRTMVPVYDPDPNSPTHQKLIPRDQYAGQPTGSVNQTSPGDVMGGIMQKVQQGGLASLTPNDRQVIDLNKQVNPLAAFIADQLSKAGGGGAPSIPVPDQSPAAATPPAAASAGGGMPTITDPSDPRLKSMPKGSAFLTGRRTASGSPQIKYVP